MMLSCVEDGSIYAADILKELYKTYYKKEYDILKRIGALGIESYSKCFDPDDKNNEEKNGDTDFFVARITIMCELFHIMIDDTWNGVFELLNERAERDRFLWRSFQALGMEDKLIEKKSQKRKKYSDWIAERYPEMASKDIYEHNKQYKLIEDLDEMVSRVMNELNVFSTIDDENGFDLFGNMIEGLDNMDIDIDDEVDSKWSLREFLLIAYINYISKITGKLYKERERELHSILGASRLELVENEDLISDSITKEMIERLEQKDNSRGNDYRKDKLMSRIASLDYSEVKRIEKKKNDIEKHSKQEIQVKESLSEIEVLKAELRESRIRIRNEADKAQNQRVLYEENKEKIKSLEKIIEKQSEEHEELVALRELVYRLDRGDMEPEHQINTEDMLKILNEKHCAIIGGHENWSNKMKKALPKWEIIPVSESLNLDKSISSVDMAFIYTDVLEHKMYYKMMNVIRSNNIPFHYVHGVNTDIVVRAMYEALGS